MSLADDAALESILKAMADQIAEQLKEVRQRVQAALDDTQALGAAAKLPNGKQVAKVVLSDPKPAAVVTDQDAFVDWVRDTFDGEVVTRVVTEVRPATATAILAQATDAGVARWFDKETGEVHDVPGVEIKATRSRSHSMRFDKGGREAIAEAWRNGELTHLVLPQITAGADQ